MVDGLAKEVENEKMKVGLVCHLNGIPEKIHTSPMEEIGS
jgi:hypothetical protein